MAFNLFWYWCFPSPDVPLLMYPVSRAQKIPPLYLLMLKVRGDVKRWQLAPCSPSQFINKEENWEGKSNETLMNWDKDSLIGKEKAAHTEKANQGIQSPLPMSRLKFSPLHESRVPSTHGEEKHHHSEYFPPSFFFPLYTLSIIWDRISLGSFGISCSGCVPY